MKKKYIFAALTALLAAAGYFLRCIVLTRGFDAQGLPIADFSWTALIAVCVLAAAFSVFAALNCCKTARFEKVFTGNTVSVLVGIAAVAACVFGGVLTVRDAADGLQRVGGILITVGALGWLGVLAAQKKKTQPSPWLQFPMPVGLVLVFIGQFRSWSVDPIIGDYAFKLLAAAAELLGLYYLAGFALNCGKPRMTVFFALITVLFTAISLPDGEPARLLTSVGCSLWLLCGAVPLLRKSADDAEV